MNDKTTSRWDAFTPMELQALDEFFRNFGPLREHNPDILTLGSEIAATMQRREITPFGPTDPRPEKPKTPPGPQR
jgi:hypothetical protein